MQQYEIQKLLDKVNLLFSVLLKDGIENTTQIERELLKEQLQKLLSAINSVEDKPISKCEVTEVVSQKEINEEPNSNEIEAQQEEVQKVIQEVEIAPVQAQVPEKSSKEDIAYSHLENADYTKKIKEIIGDRLYTDKNAIREMNHIIDLNKSFILKQELFNNDNDSYKKVINELGSFSNEKESFEYLEQMATKFNWDIETKAFELMVKAIEKRFIPIL